MTEPIKNDDETHAHKDRRSTERFSDRVDAYVRYRPSYPDAVVETLRDLYGMTASSVIADIGSGTGISAELFLCNGNKVFAVEPNRDMRRAAENGLRQYEEFVSLDGRAEATTLPESSVDFVIAAQAFHWFDDHAARREFARILRAAGWTVLLWNTRRVESTPFLQDYEALLKDYGTDYLAAGHRSVDPSTLRRFFGDDDFRRHVFENEQELDLDGLRGRLESSSYVPTPGHPSYQPMMSELERIYYQHESGGMVRIEYDTEMYVGRLSDKVKMAGIE